jgi:predicted RNA methylase
MVDIEPSPVNGYFSPQDPGGRLSVNDHEAELIGGMVRGLHVLEIGTGLGVSTRALAMSARKVVTIDIDPWVQENIWPVLLDDLPNLEVHSEIPWDAAPFEAVFIDGDHSEKAVLKDIDFSKPFARADCVYIFHDSKYTSVRNAIEKRFKQHTHINTAAGIGIGYRKDLR